MDVKNKQLSEAFMKLCEDNLNIRFIDVECEVQCDICGDYHESDSVPLSCETGDGEQ